MHKARMETDSGQCPTKAASERGTTALMLAGESGNMETCHLLLAAGANVNAKDLRSEINAVIATLLGTTP